MENRRAVLQDRFAAADLLQCQLAAFVVQLLLMSAFSSSRRVNSWLSFKRLFEAVPGTA
jgi:hypothetical protein